jgi:hypothetical protein
MHMFANELKDLNERLSNFFRWIVKKGLHYAFSELILNLAFFESLHVIEKRNDLLRILNDKREQEIKRGLN